MEPNWTEKDIENFATLIVEFNTGGEVNGHLLTRNIKEWNGAFRLYKLNEERGKNHQTKYAWYEYFLPAQDAPVEVLWRLVKPMIKTDPIGFSLAKSSGWRALGLYDANSRFWNEKAQEEMEHVLNRLAQAGYIYFNSAGIIWEIRIKEKAA